MGVVVGMVGGFVSGECEVLWLLESWKTLCDSVAASGVVLATLVATLVALSVGSTETGIEEVGSCMVLYAQSAPHNSAHRKKRSFMLVSEKTWNNSLVSNKILNTNLLHWRELGRSPDIVQSNLWGNHNQTKMTFLLCLGLSLVTNGGK